MNYAMMLAYAIVMVMAPVVPFLVYSLVKELRVIYKALCILQSEKRAGETLYDCAEAIAGDAHNWRGMVTPPQANSTAPEGYVLTEDWHLAAVVPQPPPQNSSGPALWPLIIISELGDSETDRLVAIDMQARHEFGVAKYGVPLVASNGRDHLADAYQEALDCVVYMRAAFDSQANATHVDYEAMRSGAICGLNDLGRSRLHQLYVDALDMAKEIREMIQRRDGL